MYENIVCTIVTYLWVPLVLVSLLVLAYQVIKYRKEKDPLEKDKRESMIKYPVILLIFSIISIPFWDFLIQAGVLPLNCKTEAQILGSNHVINDFSDGSKQKNISFIIEGGFNSDTEIIIPRNAKINKATLDLVHQPEETWIDHFYNWSYVESHESAGLNQDEGYAFLEARKLDVNTTISLDGSQIFDDVYIRKGGEIRVPHMRTLDLAVRGTLTIEPGSGIRADGTLDRHNTGKEYDKVSGETASGGGGGGYGGSGGKGGDDPPMRGGNGGVPYGSETEPIDIGERGAAGGGTRADSGSGYPGSGGYGGSAIKIQADRVVVDGYITANGGNGEDSSMSDGSAGGGGGSGGSIQLTARTLILNGEITANGGNGGNDQSDKSDSDGGGGGGSGGRISISYNQKGGFGKASAAGGKGGQSREPAKNGADGGAGTVYWASKEMSAMSIISANITSKEISFDNLGAWKKFYANTTIPGGSDIKFSIIEPYSGRTICKIGPQEALHGYDIETCSGNADSIKLQTEMNTITFSRTPILYYWGILYDTEIKDLEMDIGTEQITEYSTKAFSGKITISDDNTKPGITEVLNKLVKECTCRGCNPTGDYQCKINIRFSSKSSGKLTVENPQIEYSE